MSDQYKKMLSFSPLESLTGGILLFLASSSYLALNGEVLGISGLLENAFHSQGHKRRMAWNVLAGLSAGGIISRLMSPANFTSDLISSDSTPVWIPVLGGAIIGLGTRLGSGCTSGHLLCGIARGSQRSAIASISFITTAMVTTLLFHTNPRQSVTYIPPTFAMIQNSARILVLAAVNFELIRRAGGWALKSHHEILFTLIAFSAGLWFAIGLFLSGMLIPAKVLSFLDITSFATWDPSLLMVLIGGIIPNALTYHLHIKNTKHPLFRGYYSLPTKNEINWELVVGGALFGVGWGWLGVCPGPGFVNLVAIPSWRMLGYTGGWWVGMEMSRFIKEIR